MSSNPFVYEPVPPEQQVRHHDEPEAHRAAAGARGGDAVARAAAAVGIHL